MTSVHPEKLCQWGNLFASTVHPRVIEKDAQRKRPPKPAIRCGTYRDRGTDKSPVALAISSAHGGLGKCKPAVDFYFPTRTTLR